MFAVSDRLDSGIQQGVHKLSIWARAKGPADDPSVEAVDHRRQVHLASRNLELRDAGEPLLVRLRSWEVAIDEMLWRRADFSRVGSVRPSLLRSNDQAILLHQTLNHLLRDRDVLPAERRVNPAVAIAAVIALEDVGDGPTPIALFVSNPQPGPRIEIGASRPRPRLAKRSGRAEVCFRASTRNVFSRFVRRRRSTPRPFLGKVSTFSGVGPLPPKSPGNCDEL